MTITPDVPVAFGRWLKRLRNQQNLTQEVLAEAVYCSVQLIRFWEGGRRRPSLEMAERLADVLQVPADQRTAFIQQARLPVEGAESAAEEELVPSPTVLSSEKPSLPPLDHPLIGREGEHNVLRHLLLEEQRRLVTLIGAGGMGKTHLALDVATALAPHFRDGAAFVSLTTLPSATHLPGAVADALHMPLGPGDPQEQSLALLAPRHLLLVLDDFEPLLNRDNGAAVQWVNRLLQRAPHVQVLVTSRERLRLSGERIFELAGLALPSPTLPPEAADAVLLFMERAQQAAGYFVLDAQNKAAVTRICQLVDGMPLGIELAAAWVRVLTAAEIADELAKNIDFLARANRDTPMRHRSLRAIFDHSWELLDATEQRALMRLAVFRGGCQREAAQTVAKAPLPILASLIDKSLVRRTQTGSQARYDLHEVVRQFAEEKRQALGTPTPADDVQAAHYDYFYTLAVTAKVHLQGGEQLHWLGLLDEEHANLRAALDTCLTLRDSDRGLRLAIQLEDYWYMRGYHREGLQTILGFLALTNGRQPPAETAMALAAAGLFAIAGGSYSEALRHLERSVTDARTRDDNATLGRALRYLGIVHLREGKLAVARQEFVEAATVNEQIGQLTERAITLGHLAEIALLEEDYTEAQRVGEQIVQLLRTVQNKNQLAGALRRLALTHAQLGHHTLAIRYALESLDLNREVGDLRGTAASIVALSTLLQPQAQWAAIAQLLGAADALLARAQAFLLPADQIEDDRIRTRCQQQLGNAFATEHERGRARLAHPQALATELAWVRPLFLPVATGE